MIESKSLHISCAVSNFYGTEIEIWAGFGLVGNSEKKIWADYEQLLRSVYTGANIVTSALKRYIK